MTIKRFVKSGVISTIAVIASNNPAFAASCTAGLAGYCLTDGGAEFEILHNDVGGTNSDQFGMEMQIDGRTQVWVLDFMIDNTTVAGPHTGTEGYLGDPTVGSIYTGTNKVDIIGKEINLTGIKNAVAGTIDLSFELNYTGPDAATLTQSFTFTNTTNAAITDLSFIALADVTLGGGGLSGFNDRGELTTGTNTNPTGYRQWSNNGSGLTDFELLASVDVPVDSYEVSVANVHTQCSDNSPGGTPGAGVGDLCYRVINEDVVTLSDSVYQGEADIMLAARWLRTVNAGQSFTYTQTFQISELIATPVPAAVWLFGSGLLGLIGVARRKQSLNA